MPSSGSGTGTPVAPPGPPVGLSAPRDLCETMLTLDRFSRILGYSPLLMHQVYVPELQPASSCSDPILQYTWQPRGGGRPSRQEMANAICQAEAVITDALGFSPLPRWQADEGVMLARPRPGGRMVYPIGPYASYLSVITRSKYVLYGGAEAFTTLELSSPITYSDQDGDGYFETATVTVAITDVTTANEIAVFYPGTAHDPSWRIKPIRVDIDPLILLATITFGRHLAVKPELTEQLDANGVDGLNDANFLTGVDVYRQYNDPSQMATVEWPAGLCEAAGPGVTAAQAAVFTVSDARSGVISLTPATWDGASSYVFAWPAWPAQPERVRLWYKAGLTNSGAADDRTHHQLTSALERAIAYLALSYLDREWQDCEQLHNLHAHWRADLSMRRSSAAESTSFNRRIETFDNPFGTTRAAVHAWGIVKRLAVGEAVLGS